MTGKQVVALLKAKGWKLARIKGSHYIMSKSTVKVPVPVHGAQDLGAGLIAAIARQTGETLK